MYLAPVSEIAFTLKHVAGFGEALGSGAFPGLTEDLVDAVLAEAGRFASDAVAPLNRIGDTVGAQLKDGGVETAPGWRRVYEDWCAGGWNGISAPESAGGQGLPLVLSAATQEMWNAACISFSLCPLLTMGAVEALDRHGSDRLKALYLPRMVSGIWTATMNLTEPQAGSDLGTLTTRAEPRGDGAYRLFGQKISARTSCILSSPDFPMRRKARAASRSFWCQSSSWTRRVTSARETMSSAPASSTSSASMARPPAP
jgi:alkylation response protein AidB-like acyl-CoA dehydrogenase